MRFASAESTATMMVGSVRGNERLEIVVRVVQGGLVGVGWAASLGGQARLVPEFTDRVGWPQVPQNVLRMFQSMRARDCA